MASDQPDQGVIRQRVLQLMAQKNKIEDEIKELTGILTQVPTPCDGDIQSHTQIIPQGRQEEQPPKSSHEKDHEHAVVDVKDPQNITSSTQIVPKGRQKELTPTSKHEHPSIPEGREHMEQRLSENSVDVKDPQCSNSNTQISSEVKKITRSKHGYIITEGEKVIHRSKRSLTGAARKRFRYLLNTGMEREEAYQRALNPIHPAKASLETGSKRPLPKEKTAGEKPQKIPKVSNESVRASQPLSSQGTRLGIIHGNYPKEILSKGQLNIIQESIMDHILKVDLQDQIKPSFHNLQIRHGYLTVVSNNMSTTKWLKKIAHSIGPKGVPVKVVEGSDLPNNKVLLAHLPSSKEYSDEKIMTFLKTQNALDFLSWKVLKRNTDGPSLELTVLADERSSAEIKSRGYKLSYRFGTVQNGVGMNDPLVDAEGYPINSIDIYQVRHARHRIICLQNDHQSLMKQIENGLQGYYFVTSSSGAMDTQPAEISGAPRPEIVVHKTPFARVNLVSEGSPADYAGVHVNDEIVEFGSVNSTNFKAMTDIVTVVQHSEGSPVSLKLKRGGDRYVTVSLIPKKWMGRGLLGCNIVPL